jgi:hypothetical protein
MTIHVSSGVDKLETTGSGVRATLKGGKTQDFSHCIIAIGIVPNTENIGLEALGVKTERGHIVTDGYGRTNVEGIYAIGDVTGPPWLAHKASHEGVICVEAIAGKQPHAMETGNIPGCTYSRPQVASVGFTEAKAKEVGYEVKVGKFPFIGNGKAIALGEAEGFHQDRVRRQDRRAARRAHGGRGSDRAHPGLCGRAPARDHRGRPHAHHLPAPDLVRNDARKRARRIRARGALLTRARLYAIVSGAKRGAAGMVGRNFWAVKHPEGWVVREEGLPDSTTSHTSAEDAWAAARERAAALHGEAFLQDEDGEIRERENFRELPKDFSPV